MTVQKKEILEDNRNVIGIVYDHHRGLINTNHQRDKRNIIGRYCSDDTTFGERQKDTQGES